MGLPRRRDDARRITSLQPPLVRPRAAHLSFQPTAWHGWLVASLVLCAAYFLVGGGSTAGSVIYLASSIGVVGAIAAGLLIHRPADRRPWLLFAAGQLLLAVGDTIWSWYGWLGSVAPYPGIADVAYLASYPFLTLGVLALMRGWGRPNLGDVLDGAIVAVVAGIFAWIVILEPLMAAGGESTFELAVSLGLPVGDVLLLCALAQVGFRRRRLPSLRFLLAGAALLLIADTAYSALSMQGMYEDGALLDAGWLLSYALWGLAALHPSMRDTGSVPRIADSGDPLGRLVVLAGAIIAGPVLLLTESATGGDHTVAIGIAMLFTTGLVSGRVLLISRERQQARTDLGESEGRLRELFEATHRASLKLRDQNEELRDVDRMKDDLISLVSHELRTPLTSILGYLELVLSGDDGPLNDDQRQHLGTVERSGHRLLRVVSDLLFVAQAQAGMLTLNCTAIGLEPLVRDSVDAAEANASALGISLTFEATETPTVAVDQQRLAQVVDNLVSNALKFSERGGHVTVRLHRAGDLVAIDVSDDGMGIAPDEQRLLFGRFFRTDDAMKRAVQGTGLGLSIVKAIVDAHGGEIVVDSESGVGSTFQVLLPAAAA